MFACTQADLAASRAEVEALRAQAETAEQERSRLRQAGLEALTAVGSELDGMRTEVAQVWGIWGALSGDN